MIKKLICVVVLCIIASGCSSSNTDEVVKKPTKKGGDSLLPYGNYEVSMYDSAGGKLLDAVMTIDSVGPSANADMKLVIGSYKIIKDYADFSGRSTISGEFEGYLNNDRKVLSINTNPRIADANVFINFNIVGKTLDGSWNYSTYRGSTNKGKVSGRRK